MAHMREVHVHLILFYLLHIFIIFMYIESIKINIQYSTDLSNAYVLYIIDNRFDYWILFFFPILLILNHGSCNDNFCSFHKIKKTFEALRM